MSDVLDTIQLPVDTIQTPIVAPVVTPAPSTISQPPVAAAADAPPIHTHLRVKGQDYNRGGRAADGIVMLFGIFGFGIVVGVVLHQAIFTSKQP